jgi:hypothetical protein
MENDYFGIIFLLSNFKIRQMCLATIRRKKQLKNISDTVTEEKNNKKYERGEDEGVLCAFFRKSLSSTKLMEERISVFLSSLPPNSTLVWHTISRINPSSI